MKLGIKSESKIKTFLNNEKVQGIEYIICKLENKVFLFVDHNESYFLFIEVAICSWNEISVVLIVYRYLRG